MYIDIAKRIAMTCLLAVSMMYPFGFLSAQQQTAPTGPEVERFKQAWKAANKGDRALFQQLKNDLGDYILYPYLEYEDFRFRRGSVDATEMAAFLEKHHDWAFSAGLKKAWLRSLGKRKRWDELLLYASDESDIDVQCYQAQAKIKRGLTDDLLPVVQNLWSVGQSQPKTCDPVFQWLRKNKGITPELAWLRISRAMAAKNPRLTQYLIRYIPVNDRVWVERWQKQHQQSYRRLDQARSWRDSPQRREITAFGLKNVARRDSDRAWELYGRLDGNVKWLPEERAAILKEIAMWSAVENASDSIVRLHSVPVMARDSVLLEWWARHGLSNGNWAEVVLAINDMSDELKNSDRWRYWDARARLNLGEPDYGTNRLIDLSSEASYYGFLAADFLNQPYTICPTEPNVAAQELQLFKNRPMVERIMALRKAGMKNWSLSEWNLAVKTMSKPELRLAAALADEQGWPDLAILALASSGDRTWYEWRFPLSFTKWVKEHTGKRNLDMAWVMGLIRSESAMAEGAISPANARGLMQVMPGTASQLANRHSYQYRGSEQLMQAESNIIFGTTFLRELMDRFNENPVLVTGAYNAGPAAVDRWLDAIPNHDPLIWVEVLPYYETRDYIPRVLAFATIYNWRLQQPVQRISSRMPVLDSGSMGSGVGVVDVAQVVCPASKTVSFSGS